MSHVLKDVSDHGVATLTINRPEVRNAWSIDTVTEMTAAVEAFRDDPRIRALVLAGAGRAFSAGGDLNWMRSILHDPDGIGRSGAEKIHRLLQAIGSFPHPVIARVNGPAFGGGFGMVCAADIAIASTEPLFGLSEVRLGIVPAVISPFVLRRLGGSTARATCLTGAAIGTDEALRIGLVHRVTEPGDLDAAVSGMLGEILQSSPVAVAASKKLFNDIERADEEEHLSIALDAIARAWRSEAAAEGISAFLGKRPPAWRVTLADV